QHKAPTTTTTATTPPGVVDPTKASISVSPTTAPADGRTRITITVTLRDSTGAPVAGKTVRVTNTVRGNQFTVGTAPTNSAGVVTMYMTAGTTPGIQYFSAYDVDDANHQPLRSYPTRRSTDLQHKAPTTTTTATT